MADKNLILFAAGYSQSGVAEQDYEALKELKDVGAYVTSAVIMDRDAEGKVSVRDKEHLASGGAWLGGGVGVVVGLFAPPLLAATAIGAGIGAAIGGLTKHHREHDLEAELDEVLPNNSSAIVAVLDDVYQDKVEAALAKADKKVVRPVDAADAKNLEAALSSTSDSDIVAQLNS